MAGRCGGLLTHSSYTTRRDTTRQCPPVQATRATDSHPHLGEFVTRSRDMLEELNSMVAGYDLIVFADALEIAEGEAERVMDERGSDEDK